MARDVAEPFGTSTMLTARRSSVFHRTAVGIAIVVLLLPARPLSACGCQTSGEGCCCSTSDCRNASTNFCCCKATRAVKVRSRNRGGCCCTQALAKPAQSHSPTKARHACCSRRQAAACETSPACSCGPLCLCRTSPQPTPAPEPQSPQRANDAKQSESAVVLLVAQAIGKGYSPECLADGAASRQDPLTALDRCIALCCFRI